MSDKKQKDGKEQHTKQMQQRANTEESLSRRQPSSTRGDPQPVVSSMKQHYVSKIQTLNQ